MNILTDDNIKQLALIVLITFVGVTVAWNLYTFFPGLLGAITLYIIMREYYFKLTVKKKWRRWITSTIFILGSIIIFALPIVLLFQMLLPRFNSLLSDTGQLSNILDNLGDKLSEYNLPVTIDSDQILSIIQNISSGIPSFLGATANLLTNGVLAFFLLYFMLVDGEKMEKKIHKYAPLQEANLDDIWLATRTMVMSNAIGIPLLAASQAIAAIIGYLVLILLYY